MKNYKQITSSLLSFAPVTNLSPITTFQKIVLTVGDILSKLNLLIFLSEFVLIFFLLYQSIKWLKAKISHNENEAVLSWKSIKKSLFYFIILLISFILMRIFFLNCLYYDDVGFSLIFDACFNPYYW